MAAASVAAALWRSALLLGGCFRETYQRGYIVPEGALEQIPIGSSQEQVLIVLGTPSTVATVSGEAFYYISQRAERPIAFMPQKVVDQRVVAVYFDKNRRVERLANYGLKDGKVFDFVSRTTPTGGKDVRLHQRDVQAVLERLMRGLRPEPGPRISAHPGGPTNPRGRRRGDSCFQQAVQRQCASTASSSSATMLVILIIGLTAGPAVSL